MPIFATCPSLLLCKYHVHDSYTTQRTSALPSCWHVGPREGAKRLPAIIYRGPRDAAKKVLRRGSGGRGVAI